MVTSPDEMAQAKRRLRAQIAKRIAGMSSAEAAEKSAAAVKRLESLPEYAAARVLLLYYGMAGEILTTDLMERAIAAGKTVALPACVPGKAGEMDAFIVSDIQKDLRPGAYEILEPDPAAAKRVKPGKIDIIIVPGRAFDERGNRLGRGAGYYDKYIARLHKSGTSARAAALAFEMQIVDDVPVDAGDVPVDAIVTEERIIRSLPR
jgi:5-formyltetrahydrofolate cyclo-ligase